jgi:phosphoglycolate phosphatase-like HAD superfamily hydrolase
MSGLFFLLGLLREINHSTSKATIERLEERHAEYFTKGIKTIRVLPGARELLRRLTAIRLPWTIATSGERAQVQKLVKGLALPKPLPVVTGDDVKHAKPRPIFSCRPPRDWESPSAIASLWVTAPKDFLAGRRMNVLGVGLLCGGYAKEELERAGAHLVYEDPAELLENLAELGISEMP